VLGTFLLLLHVLKCFASTWQAQNLKLVPVPVSSNSTSSPLTVVAVTPEDFSGPFSVAALHFAISFA